jgi:hypothetical protein
VVFFFFWGGRFLLGFLVGLTLARQACYHLSHSDSQVLFFETRSHYVAQSGFELKIKPPASASQVLGLQAYTTSPNFLLNFLFQVFCQRQKAKTPS